MVISEESVHVSRFQILPFGGHSKEECLKRIQDVLESLQKDQKSLHAVAKELRRESMNALTPFRYVLMSDKAEDAIERLSKVTEEDDIVESETITTDNIAFFFVPQGPQHQNMEVDLFGECPVFEKELNRLIDAGDEILGGKLRRFMYPTNPEDVNRKFLMRGDLSSSSMFVITNSLRVQLNAWGIESPICGTWSSGEIAGAAYANAIDGADAVKFYIKRGQIYEKTQEVGFILLEEPYPIPDKFHRINRLTDRWQPFFGETEEIKKFDEKLTFDGVKHKCFYFPHGYHSPFMSPIYDDIRELVNATPFRPTDGSKIILSGMDGTDMKEYDADYWIYNAGNMVRTDLVIDRLVKHDDVKVVLQVGPMTALSKLFNLYGCELPVIKTAAERHEDSNFSGRIYGAVAELFLRGYNPEFRKIYPEDF